MAEKNQIDAWKEELAECKESHGKVEETLRDLRQDHKMLAHRMSDLRQSIDISEKLNRVVDVSQLGPVGVESGENVGTPGS